jgi:3-dehydroquinate dehydratase-2
LQKRRQGSHGNKNEQVPFYFFRLALSLQQESLVKILLRMIDILIINGPNLNLLGKREPSIYGNSAFDACFRQLQDEYGGICRLSYFQSNHEGGIIDKLHETGFSYAGIVLNAGAYTHTSVAIHDAIKAIDTPVIEVHISNIHAREEFRHKSVIAPACRGAIIGLGFDSYRLAVDFLCKKRDKA